MKILPEKPSWNATKTQSSNFFIFARHFQNSFVALLQHCWLFTNRPRTVRDKSQTRTVYIFDIVLKIPYCIHVWLSKNEVLPKLLIQFVSPLFVHLSLFFTPTGILVRAVFWCGKKEENVNEKWGTNWLGNFGKPRSGIMAFPTYSVHNLRRNAQNSWVTLKAVYTLLSVLKLHNLQHLSGLPSYWCSPDVNEAHSRGELHYQCTSQ